MRAFLLLLLSVTLASGQTPGPANVANLKMSAVPVQGAAASLARLYSLSATGVGESITPTVAWEAIVLTGQVDTVDISGISVFARTVLDDASATDMKTTLSLQNVDNTSDVNKPVSTAQAAADALKLNLTGGTISGNLAVSGLVSNSGGLKRVAADFSKTNDTLADVTGLSVTVDAGATYRFRAVLFTTLDAGGGKVAIAGTATATAIRGYVTYLNSSPAVGAAGVFTALGGAVNTAGFDEFVTIEGTIVVNAGGTLTVQFAQNVTNVTQSSVLIGSYFEVTGF